MARGRCVKGLGLVEDLGLRSHVYATIHPFGKSFGCMGCAVLTNHSVFIDYLVNYSRSLNYTTGLTTNNLITMMVCFNLVCDVDVDVDAV